MTLCLVFTLMPALAPAEDRHVLESKALLHFEEHGKGPPLVLLHHFGWSSKIWTPFFAQMSRSHRVIAIDLPAHGGSDGWRTMQRFDYPDAARRVLATLDSLGVKRFSAIGLSAGALTFLEVAIRAPDRVDSLVLVGSTTHVPDATRVMLREHMCGEDPPEYVHQMLEYQPGGEPQIHALSRLFCAEKDSTESISLEQLKGIKARTLIVHGDSDPVFPVEIAVQIYRAIPSASLWVEPKAGHVFVLKPEFADAFLARSLKFLDAPP